MYGRCNICDACTIEEWRIQNCITLTIPQTKLVQVPRSTLCLALLDGSGNLGHHLRSIPQIIDLCPSRIPQTSHVSSLHRTLDHLDILDHRTAHFEAHLYTRLVDDVSKGEACVDTSATDPHQDAGECRGVRS